MSRIDYARAFSSPGVRRKKESRTPKRPGTTAGNPRATSHERLAGQERRRRSSAHTGAGGGGGLAGKHKARAWYPGRQCIATAPLPGAPFACQVGAISLRSAVAPVRTGERPAYPRPICTSTNGRGRSRTNGRGRSRSCAKPAIALNWWRTHDTGEAEDGTCAARHQARTARSRCGGAYSIAPVSNAPRRQIISQIPQKPRIGGR